MSVSVVIPAYNASKYLPEALESLKNQTRQPDEILLVDDASKDHTARIAAEYGCRVFVSPTNMGIGFSRQIGAEKARSDYVTFLSADDAHEPNFLKFMLPYAKQDRGVFCDYWQCDSNLIPKSVFSYKPEQQIEQDIITWALRKNMFVCFNTIILPKRIFSEVKFHSDLKRGEDLVFLLETLVHGLKWAHIPFVLSRYRVNSNPSKNSKKQWIQLWNTQTPLLKQLGVSSDRILEARRQNEAVCFPILPRWLRRLASRLLPRPGDCLK